jgi:hypothetical protein
MCGQEMERSIGAKTSHEHDSKSDARWCGLNENHKRELLRPAAKKTNV